MIVNKKVRKFNELSFCTIQVVEGLRLTEELLQFLTSSGVFAKDPLMIFPGEGAKSVYQYLKRLGVNMSKATFLKTERNLIRPGVFNLSADFSSLPTKQKPNTVVIFDDVVASGQTASEIVRGIKNRFPEVEIFLASWLFLYPTGNWNKESPSGIELVDKSFTSIAIQGNYSSRPPINSISCFLRNDNGKYEQTKRNWVKKYIADADEFNRRVKEIGGVIL